jgi:hypothetical protein
MTGLPDGCTCICVYEGRGWPDPQPAEYEPSETCLVHGLGTPQSAFAVQPDPFPESVREPF